MYIKSFISKNSSEYNRICESHKVKYMFAFGSSVSSSFNLSTSDIDLLVDIDVTDPLEKGELLMSLWDALEIFFQRKVDLVTKNSLKNPYLISNIEKNKTLIYDRTSQEISS
jgi:uncharacterized protein